ncbi:hypothetical protein Bcep18194_C7093 [Burkholderia lata]|uniref:Uncharacterized protein n=1 Tax=Burkholderia lata (strain ATCC 17760 / DSM 23089 / LMG 22485 / NCIMB 9086 / R18194 / 383) TaxID=482957 RepID=Q39N29_BURL3|nr:hypothetical protein Bcep18194_C7093 [Burkholderia lata]
MNAERCHSPSSANPICFHRRDGKALAEGNAASEAGRQHQAAVSFPYSEYARSRQRSGRHVIASNLEPGVERLRRPACLSAQERA